MSFTKKNFTNVIFLVILRFCKTGGGGAIAGPYRENNREITKCAWLYAWGSDCSLFFKPIERRQASKESREPSARRTTGASEPKLCAASFIANQLNRSLCTSIQLWYEEGRPLDRSNPSTPILLLPDIAHQIRTFSTQRDLNS